MKQYIQPQAYRVAFHDEALMHVLAGSGEKQLNITNGAAAQSDFTNQKDLSNGWDDCWNAL